MHRNFLLDTGTNVNVLLIFFFSSRFWLWIHHNLGCVKKKWFMSIVLDLIGEHFSVFRVCRIVLEQKILFINSFTDLTSENGCKGIFYVALARFVGKFSWIIYLAISLSIFLVWNWKKNYSYQNGSKTRSFGAALPRYLIWRSIPSNHSLNVSCFSIPRIVLRVWLIVLIKGITFNA